MKLLDVGAGRWPIRPEVIERVFGLKPDQVEVWTLDVDAETKPNILHDIRKPLPEEYHGQFDVVWMSHVLEHFGRYECMRVLKNIRDALKNLGEFWVFVPSLEWCAKQILSDHPSPGVLPSLYGAQDNEWQFHKNGFTLRGLRTVLTEAGFIPRHVFHTEMTINMVDTNGKRYAVKAMQNCAMAIRYDVEEQDGEETLRGVPLEAALQAKGPYR